MVLKEHLYALSLLRFYPYASKMNLQPNINFKN